MSDVEMDQEVYDRLIAEGKGERVARAKAKAAAIRKQRAAEAAEAKPEQAEESAAAPADEAPADAPAAAQDAPAAQAVTPAEGEIDQEVYDRLIAEGKSERIARAKAKAAAVRKAKIAQGQQLGPKSAEEAKEALEGSRAAGGAGAEAKVPAAAAAAAPAQGGRLTPEQRAERVAASLGGGSASQTSIGVPAASDHTHRLLALVPPSGIQQVQSKQMDKVYTWPHLLLVEFVALLAVGSLLLIAAFFLDAPLGSLANPNEVPAINKAPWYFMGLQELLRYFHPMVAGVTLPGVFLVVLAAAPYVDKNPSARPENRKFANMAFTFFMTFWAILVIIGSFIRGAGYEWVWPWVQGLGFSL